MQSKHPGDKYPGSTVVSCDFDVNKRKWDQEHPNYMPNIHEAPELLHSEEADPPRHKCVV